MVLKRVLIFMLVSLLALPLLAQEEPNEPTVLDVVYDDVVDDSITAPAFWDWWKVQATQGDIIVVDMAASGGLEPLIGILDPTGTLAARSEDGAADSTIQLEYTAPVTGEYTIVATRVGNADGTSTGTYTLRLRRANTPVVSDPDQYQDVTFVCADIPGEVTTAATIRFAEEATEGLKYRITVYGLDGFRPVIRIKFDLPNKDEPFELCNLDAEQMIGDTFTLPGEDTRTVTAETLNGASQLSIAGSAEAGVGVITLTIGSLDGAAGRYMAVIEGFAIDPKDDTDLLEVRVGPLAAETTSIQTYMVAAPNSRLDPFMMRPDNEEICDDAGRGDCEAVLSFRGAGATLTEGDVDTVISGARSDAGMVVNPGTPDTVALELSSRSGNTHGAYAVFLIGILPPRG